MDSNDIYNEIIHHSKNKHYAKRYFKYIMWCGYQIPESGQYSEKHHILPKSLFPEYKDLKNNDWNLIVLSFRQHYICHWILAKAFGGKMWFAFHAMNMESTYTEGKRLYKNSRIYDYSKKYMAEQMSIAQNNFWKNNEEKRIECSQNMLGNKNHFYGKQHTEETKQKLSEMRSGENSYFYGKKRPEHSDLMKIKMKNKKKSKQHKENISKSHNVEYRCPHCGVTGGRMVLRWHYKNCYLVNEKVSLYKATNPNNEEFLFGNVFNFCEEHNLSYKAVKRYLDDSISDLYAISDKATVISEKALNLVGWKLEKIR